MHGSVVKKIGSVFLLLTFSMISPSEKPWYTTVSQYQIQYCIAEIATALVVRKLSYNYYDKTK